MFYTVTEAAKAVGMHRETIAEALRTRTLHGFQPSKHAHWRVKPACLEAYVEQRPCEHKAALARGKKAA